MIKVKDTNYYTVQGFMRNKLQLKGLELQVYAIIYGFSQTEGTYFTGGTTYLEEWTGHTRRGIFKVLKSLEEKNFIIRLEPKIQGVYSAVHYKVNHKLINCEFCTKQDMNSVHTGDELSSQVGMNSVHRGYELSSQVGMNSVHRGYELSSPTHYNNNNNILYNEIKNDNNIISEADKSANVCVKKSKSTFQKPTEQEILIYIIENQLNVNSVQFYNYYESNGWKVGKNQMKDWRAALKSWHINYNTKKSGE